MTAAVRILCPEIIDGLPCAYLKGHLRRPHEPSHTDIDNQRIQRLLRYEAALRKIAAFGGDCGKVATDALEGASE